ncbi:aconitase family protein [Veillonella sp.]|uniref:aconitase family protein n=1 Tax=Veillonella sp. TaxID=1926307 RepID=UPI0025D5FB95|nr:aconitase family protein [Veillonella sp.]
MTLNTNKTQSTNMPQNLARKILASHLISGEMNVGEEIAVRVDQTLTHDVTGTQAYLAFETMNIPKVKTELSVSYVDHNLLYADNKNPDDHIYLQTIAKKYGLYLSRAGNGICHTVHFERFGRPGMISLGSDSHTPTGSAIGALAIGAGGLDVALAMAGVPLYLKMPKIVNVKGSRQIFSMALRDGIISTLVDAGVRILECGCGPCVGIGQALRTHGVSFRTSNRNFKGRSGTLDASVYLGSPEAAAITAIKGYITDLIAEGVTDVLLTVEEPKTFIIDDNMIIPPTEGDTSDVEIIRGPNIQPMPINEPLPDTIQAHVSAYRPDNITTDDIIPANAQFSALRSNIPAISQITFSRIDPDFVKRAEGYGKSFIVGGENYGQGSSREHAAIAPMYLGVKAVITKSLARIHKNNLINHGVVPLNFVNLADYDKINQDDELKITNFPEQLKSRNIIVENLTKGFSFETKTELTEREVNILIDGGQLRQVQAKNNT